jgi:hypothetical protein
MREFLPDIFSGNSFVFSRFPRKISRDIGKKYYSSPERIKVESKSRKGCAISQAVSPWLPTAAARVRSRVWSKDLWWMKWPWGWVFSEYFGFPCQSSFHQLLHHHNHPGQATIGQSVAAVPSGSRWTPPPTKRI